MTVKNPISMLLLNLATTPYFSFGGDFGWQTWTRTSVNYMERTLSGQLYTLPFNLRQTISANGILSLDLGLDMQSALPHSKLAIQLGCRFNLW